MESNDEPNVLTCSVCREPYRCPKLLPCYHNFCLQCVEKLAENKPSFPCPTCATIIILPPGGSAALQTNIYIEKELTGVPSETSPECELCTKGIEARFKCVDCQQLYCAPCLKTHNSIPSCSSHYILPCGEEPQPGEQREEQEKPPKNCLKHKNQPLMFFCRPCDITICFHCKLTSHEGHKTEDVQDSGKLAREEIKDTVDNLAHREQALKAVLGEATECKTRVAAARDDVEAEIRSRAERLLNLVSEKREAAIQDLDLTVADILSAIEQDEQPINIKLAKVTARRQHFTRVLRGADHEALSFVSQLRKKQEDPLCELSDADSVTMKVNTITLDFIDSALTDANVIDFVGRATEIQHDIIRVPATEKPHVLEVHVQKLGQRQRGNTKKLSRVTEIVYSRNPRATLIDMCLATEEKVWLVYKFTDLDNQVLALFNNKGQKLELRHEIVHDDKRLVCVDDTLISPMDGMYVQPGGVSGKGTGISDVAEYGAMCSRQSHNNYWCAKYKGPDECNSRHNYSNSRSTELVHLNNWWLQNKLSPTTETEFSMTSLCSITNVFGFGECITVKNAFFAISSDAKYIAFIVNASCVNVLIREPITGGSDSTLKQVANYRIPEQPPATGYQDTGYQDTGYQDIDDLIFSPVKGEEMLVVACSSQNTVHIVDHQDCCSLVGTVETDLRPVERPFRLVTNNAGRVWVGCHGGKIHIFDL